jgi:sulfate adenylyltransferase subunit 1 (EFTu-like GTPase family)
MVAGAPLRDGDEVVLLPAGLSTTINAMQSGSGARHAATAGLSIDVGLAHETDAGRGDMLATAPLPTVTKEFVATVCWFGEASVRTGQRLRLKHTTRLTPARLGVIEGCVDIATLSVEAADSFTTNDIGLVTIQTADPLVVDDYQVNRVTGSFVLIDEVTNATVAAGMVGRASFL